MSKYDIIGVGGPIIDQIIEVDEAFLLSHVPGKKGGMQPVPLPFLESLIEKSGDTPHVLLGGSARNTLQGLTRFGEKCALLGMVGKDERGTMFRSLLQEQGIYPLLIDSPTPTAIVLSIVTPDGERTMRTFQGASVEIRGNHLDPKVFKQAKHVHIEGYALFNDSFIDTVMQLAKQAGATVSFDLACYEIVEKFHAKVIYLLEKYVDIVFCNQEEARALTGKGEEETCDFLAKLCRVGVVLMGPFGCFVKEGDFKKHCPAYPVQPVDTTGAGDLFASGFLHAFLQKYPVEICAHYGAIAGRAVVQAMGPSIPHEAWPQIFAQLKASE